jgi:imidazolonepropionase
VRGGPDSRDRTNARSRLARRRSRRAGRAWPIGGARPRRLPHPRLLRRRPGRRVRAPGRRCHVRGAARGRRRHPLHRETELAQLRAIEAAGGIVTWLGAHAVPPEFADADAYLDFALAKVLPEAAKLAAAADVFVENGAFDVDQARRYLTACRDAGLPLRLHGDQFTEQGAIPLAIEFSARSVDHLEATGAVGVHALAASDVTAVLLPVSALFIGRPMPPARALVDSGAAVALATDFNPGSAFCESLPLVCALAATQLKLSPAEALAACTVNAAHVLGLAERKGRVVPGYDADLVLLDVPDWRYLAYHLGHDHVAAVVLAGRRAELP